MILEKQELNYLRDVLEGEGHHRSAFAHLAHTLTLSSILLLPFESNLSGFLLGVDNDADLAFNRRSYILCDCSMHEQR